LQKELEAAKPKEKFNYDLGYSTLGNWQVERVYCTGSRLIGGRVAGAVGAIDAEWCQAAVIETMVRLGQGGFALG
jgi:hypothetical protein